MYWLYLKFIQQIFIENILCVRYGTKSWVALGPREFNSLAEHKASDK